MSQIDRFLGNSETRHALQTALGAGTLPHAVLLAGPDGCGRNFLARALAADYLYPGGGPAAEAAMRLESPELLLVEGEGKSGQIKVDRIRAVRSEVFHTGLSSSGRVVLIRGAHNMMAPAANALLKVLEEPPTGALFILTAKDAASLPLTITSRCALYALGPVPRSQCEATLREALEGGEVDSEVAQNPKKDALPPLLAAIYGRRIGLGLQALRQEGRLALLRDALSAANAAAKGDSYTLLRVFSAYEGRADEDRGRRDALLSDISDILACALRGEQAAGLPPLAPQAAARLLPLVADSQTALRGNAAPKLAFSALAIQLRRGAAGPIHTAAPRAAQ